MFACHMFVSFNMSFTSEIRVMGNELLRDQPFVAGQVVDFQVGNQHYGNSTCQRATFSSW